MSAPSQAAIHVRSPEQQEKFESGIWYTLFNWKILTVAVQNQWGGSDSSDKRDWFAGQVSELFARDPLTDAEDVEIFLLQVLEDEFDVRLEDDTEIAIARDIIQIRKEVAAGDFGNVNRLEQQFKERRGREVATGDVNVRESNQDADWDSVDGESDEDGDGDVNMNDAPMLVPAKPKEPKAAPEMDDEGFTKVVGKKRK